MHIFVHIFVCTSFCARLSATLASASRATNANFLLIAGHCFTLILYACCLSCLNSPDVIYVHDGDDKTAAVIGQLCNTNTFVELVSSANHLYMEFVSRSHFPGQGFKGRFYFETIAPIITSSVSQTRTLPGESHYRTLTVGDGIA